MTTSPSPPLSFKFYDKDQWKMFHTERIKGVDCYISVMVSFSSTHRIDIVFKQWLSLKGQYLRIGTYKLTDIDTKRYYCSPYQNGIHWKGREERIQKAKDLSQLVYLKYRSDIRYTLEQRIKTMKNLLSKYEI